MPGQATLPLVLLLLAPAADPAFKLESKDIKRIEAVLTFEVKAGRYKAEEWIAFAAQAPELPRQSKVSTRMEPAGKGLHELSAEHRPILMARLAAKPNPLEQGFSIRVIYQATLRSRDLVPLKAGEKRPVVPPLTPETRKLYLAAGETLDFRSKEFQQWLGRHGLRRKKGEPEIDFARRIFLQISKGFTYVWPVPHAGTASSTCKAARGDCGCMSAVFVSALRASGVPARGVAGRWADSMIPAKKPGEEPDYQTHVKAEFFAEGIGWVPVDATQALGDKTPLRFFGHDPGDFLVQHVDFDLMLDTIHFGKERVGVLQAIPYWVTGPPSPPNFKTHENWQVRTLH